MSKDYYSILGVDKKASKDEIKKAFRTLAHQHHPDKKGGDDAKFKEINEAYSVLSDDNKRQQYDRFGSAGPTGGFGGGNGGFDGFDFSQFTQGGNGGFEFDFGDIFGDVFGGGSRRAQAKRGRDISIDLELSFEDSVFGTERVILLNKVSKCESCSGSGAEKGSEMVTCSKCSGRGSIKEVKRTFFGQFETNAICDQCNGSGKIPKVKCKTCHGHGVHKKESEIKVRIPGGVENGEMMRLSGAGEAVAGGQSGDLYIKIYVKKHSTFKKDGYNLTMELPIKVSEALLGAEINLKTLDGDITLKVPEGVTHGEILRIKGKGVVTEKHGRGDLLVKISISLPKKLSKEARKAAEQLKEAGI